MTNRPIPAPRSAATRLCPGARSAIAAPCSASGGHSSVGTPLLAIVKSRSRTLRNSSAILFGVAPSGSCAAPKLSWSQNRAAADDIASPTAAAVSAGQNQAANGNCPPRCRCMARCLLARAEANHRRISTSPTHLMTITTTRHAPRTASARLAKCEIDALAAEHGVLAVGERGDAVEEQARRAAHTTTSPCCKRNLRGLSLRFDPPNRKIAGRPVTPTRSARQNPVRPCPGAATCAPGLVAVDQADIGRKVLEPALSAASAASLENAGGIEARLVRTRDRADHSDSRCGR